MAISNESSHVEGYFSPSAPPDAPERRAIGDHCIVELKQKYELSGDLEGAMEIDFRIYVGGPCGSPPGTFEERWIAHGSYHLREKRGLLVYLASVKAGGDVKGEIILAGDLEGTLSVQGSFDDGGMSYAGELDGA